MFIVKRCKVNDFLETKRDLNPSPRLTFTKLSLWALTVNHKNREKGKRFSNSRKTTNIH